jgi:hypothetical protein
MNDNGQDIGSDTASYSFAATEMTIAIMAGFRRFASILDRSDHSFMMHCPGGESPSALGSQDAIQLCSRPLIRDTCHG